uniref:Transcription repressor n=1 Tax=Glycine max TaxID=3847 RepID=K7MYL3_SOYBN|eukprot:XP_006604442.2 transcription repressor OFP16 [Glycine max]
MPYTNTPRTKKRNTLTRFNLNLCFSNSMQPLTPKSPPTIPTATSSTGDHNHNRPSPAAVSSTPNFDNDRSTVTPQNPFPSLGPEPEPADLATAFASQRFFFTSPGRSNSIIESANTTDADCFTTSSSSLSPVPADESATIDKIQDQLKSLILGLSSSDESEAKALLDRSVAVRKYSPDPYADFRQSMEEMVAARPELMDVAAKWRELHELLLCYLALNPKSTHKFILRAFSDFLLSLISRSYLPPQDPGSGDIAGDGGGCLS